MIVRNDDFIIGGQSLDIARIQIKDQHRDIVEYGAIHHPAVVVASMSRCPDMVEWMQEETAQGRMAPQLHGFEHIRYKLLSKEEAYRHIGLCMDWFDKQLNFIPTFWYTPWGLKGGPTLEVAAKYNLIVKGVDSRKKLRGRKGVLNRLERGKSIGDEIVMHWWQDGPRLKRALQWKTIEDE